MSRIVVVFAMLVVCASEANAQSVASLVTTLPSDFAHLFSKQSAVIVGSAAVVSVPLRPNDPAIARHARSDGDGLGAIVAEGAVLGSFWVHGSAALGTFVAGRVLHSPGVGQIGADLIRAQSVNGVITDGLKVLTSRTRPDGDQRSFPSGHTSTAFTTAAVLQRHLGWKVGIPAYTIATYVGASRVVEYRHFATDVIIGASIGLTAGRAVTVNVHRKPLAISPVVGAGTIGVSVTSR
jgi:membrane-associated phospholipid phosphatase